MAQNYPGHNMEMNHDGATIKRYDVGATFYLPQGFVGIGWQKRQ